MAEIGSHRTNLLARADEVLTAFDSTHHRLTLSAIVRRVSLPKTTVHRLVTMMTDVEWLDRSGDEYSIGVKVFGIGALCPLRTELQEIALPYLHDLFQVTSATVHLAVRNGATAMCVEKIVGHNRPVMRSRVGSTMPLHYTGVGKALLAYAPEELAANAIRLVDRDALPQLMHDLETVRSDRIAFNRGPRGDGARCVAAPIVVNGTNSVVAAVSVSLPSRPISTATLETNVQLVARAIGRALSNSQHRMARVSAPFEASIIAGH